MEIRMARGDMETRQFLLKNSSGQTYSTAPDEIYFTVKKTADDKDFIFQKRLSSGGITLIETGKYQFVIEPEDTNQMKYGEYVFDIEIVKDGLLKKTFCGKLILEKEVTHYYNEG